MGHTNDKSTKASSLVNPTSLNLQPRPFAPLDSEEKDEAVSRKSGYSENFLEKIINTPRSESAPIQRKSGNRLKAIAAERASAALQNQPIQRQESVEEEKSEGEQESGKEFIMNPEPPPIQRKFGNRLKAIAAERMAIQAKASTNEDLQSQPVQRKSGNRLKAIAAERMAIQAKLAIGEPNDKYEQEADATAARVVQQINSSTPSQSQPVQRQEMAEDEELQMKPIVQRRENIGGGEASTDLESSIQSARGGGQSLDANLQQSMGQAMGADFSGVKVHTDSQSDQLNKSIQAKAFTTGQDLFFRQGAYEPSSRGGQELIAHELTHVVQQNGGAVQRSHVAPSDIIQRSNVKVKGVKIGKTRLYNSNGIVVGNVAKGTILDINESDTVMFGRRTLVKISESSTDQLNLGSAVNTDDVRISSTRYDAMAGALNDLEEVEEDGVEIEAGPLSYQNGVVTIPIWGDQELKIGRSGVNLAGALPSKEFALDLPSFSASIDVPFAPGAYATAGLEIAPTVSFTISGGTYSIKAGTEKTLSISDAGVEGKMGLEITAKAGVGVGIANVVGLEGGIFGALAGSAALSGTLGGTANFSTNSYALNLGLKASADIVGKAGVYVSAKLAMLRATKKFSLIEKTFANFSYTRNIELGGGQGAWKPSLTDFTQKDYGDRKTSKTLKTVDGRTYEQLIDEE
jgi:hypothetical protein